MSTSGRIGKSGGHFEGEKAFSLVNKVQGASFAQAHTCYVLDAALGTRNIELNNQLGAQALRSMHFWGRRQITYK